VANKGKKRAVKRESLLSSRIYSNNFVIAYGPCERAFGIFFGLSRFFATAVTRNRFKRVFRNTVKEKLSRVFDERKDFSICLISKKGIKVEDKKTAVLELINEIRELVEKLAKKV
jgi:RNase P protein component